MIRTDARNNRVVHFEGDVVVECTDSRSGRRLYVSFHAAPPGLATKTGERIPDEALAPIGQRGGGVRFGFETVASLDVVIVRLLALRRMLAEREAVNQGAAAVDQEVIAAVREHLDAAAPSNDGRLRAAGEG